MNVRIRDGELVYVRGKCVAVPETTVAIEGREVTWNDKVIGYAWKGSRLYSPPTHRGSRIVRYHKEVPEWHAHPTRPFNADIRADTRQRALAELVANAIQDSSSVGERSGTDG